MKTTSWVVPLLALGALAGCVPEDGSGSKKVHATAFLRHGAKWTTHTLMSAKLTDADRADRIGTTAKDGYRAIYVYAANEKDYGGQSVMYTPAAKETWRKWLKKCSEAGLAVVMWMRADDSSGLDGWSDAKWETFYKDVTAGVDDLVSEYVIGLEVNEYWSASRTAKLIGVLRKYTKKPIGVHTGSISSIAYADPADKFYLQTGFGKSASAVAALVKDALGRWGGKKPVICAEYHKSGETEEARKLGEAGVKAGASGAGNGLTPTGIAMLAGK